jgi:xyloglucan fucosyltransferase
LSLITNTKHRTFTTASVFLYVVLTNCVLVDPSIEMDELFCDPFAGTTWLLPWDFPLTSYTNFSIDTAKSYGNMLDNKVFRADVLTTQLSAFIYLHLNHDYEDKMFLCADDQRLLSNVQWLVMRTNMYTVPRLFLVMTLKQELDLLFPKRDAEFHHLVQYRYLFHPTNHVWVELCFQVCNFNACGGRRCSRRFLPWKSTPCPHTFLTKKHAIRTAYHR